MADVFLIALYIVVVKGVGAGPHVEIAWGLYLFTACIWLVLVALTWATERATDQGLMPVRHIGPR